MGHSWGELVCYSWKRYADKWFVLGEQCFSLPEKPLSSHKTSCILLILCSWKVSYFSWVIHRFSSAINVLSSGGASVPGMMCLMCVNNAKVIWSAWKLWWQYCYCHENGTVSMKMVEPCDELESKLLAGFLTCFCSLLLNGMFDLQSCGCSLQVCPKRCELSTVMNLLSYKGCDVLWSSQQINNPAQVAAE